MVTEICLHYYHGVEVFEGEYHEVTFSAWWKGDRVVFHGAWCHVPDFHTEDVPSNRELRAHIDAHGNQWQLPSIFEDWKGRE